MQKKNVLVLRRLKRKISSIENRKKKTTISLDLRHFSYTPTTENMFKHFKM